MRNGLSIILVCTFFVACANQRNARLIDQLFATLGAVESALDANASQSEYERRLIDALTAAKQLRETAPNFAETDLGKELFKATEYFGNANDPFEKMRQTSSAIQESRKRIALLKLETAMIDAGIEKWERETALGKYRGSSSVADIVFVINERGFDEGFNLLKTLPEIQMRPQDDIYPYPWAPIAEIRQAYLHRAKGRLQNAWIVSGRSKGKLFIEPSPRSEKDWRNILNPPTNPIRSNPTRREGHVR